MSRARLARVEMVEGKDRFFALQFRMENATLTLLSEGGDRLGTLAMAVPQTRGLVGPTTSSLLLGERNAILARVLAERLADVTKKLSLISVFSRSIREREAAPIFVRLLDEILKAEGKEI